MSKEEAVQLLIAAGYKAKVENSVVIARVENFTKKEFEKVRKILKDAGYPMRRKTPCFSYGDIRRVHRIYASN